MGEKVEWNFDKNKPIYSQIIDQIKLFIISGELRSGERLPSVRDLAGEAGVNPNTMQRALSELEKSGLVYSNRTSGRFITEEEDIIKEIKTESAERSIREFLKNMEQIGYSKEEIIKILENYGIGDE